MQYYLLLIFFLSGTFFVVVRGEQNDHFPNEVFMKSQRASGSCLDAGLCCKGKNSSCVVQKAAPNSIVEDDPCYCDHGCVLLKDCCTDFVRACGVQDCEVSGWGTSWSSCDKECGPGSMSRSRSIQRKPRNGGKSCPPLIQKRGCRGTNCRHHKNKITVEDTAVLLPIEFSEKRKLLSGRSDITHYLRLRYPKDPDKEEKSFPYCVEFEVIQSSRACEALESFTSLREGSRICVFCDQQAQKSYADYRCAGTGTNNGISTRFSSLREPTCRGKWRHVKFATTCTCKQGPRFIFV